MHNAGFASETPNDPSGALASCRRRPYVIDEQLHIYDLYFVYFMVPYNFRVQRTHTRDLRLISINCWVVRGCRIGTPIYRIWCPVYTDVRAVRSYADTLFVTHAFKI